MRTRQICRALALPGLESRNCQRRIRPLFRLPAVALQLAFLLGKLDGRITVVLWILIVVHVVYLSVSESGVEHLGVHFVYGCKSAVLFQEEDAGSASEGIETGKRLS